MPCPCVQKSWLSGAGGRLEPAQDTVERGSSSGDAHGSLEPAEEGGTGGNFGVRIARARDELSCWLRRSGRQPVRADLRCRARNGSGFSVPFRCDAGNGEFQQGTDLLLRSAQSFNDFSREPEGREEKSELHEETAELIPVGLHPGAKIVHGHTSSGVSTVDWTITG